MIDKKSVTEFAPTRLHEWSTKLVAPLIRLLSKRGVDPNRFTELSVVIAMTTALFIAVGLWIWALVGLLLNGWCDVIDGALARSMPERSERLRQKGVFLDPAIDRINDGLFFLGILYYAIMLREEITVWYALFCTAIMAAAMAHPISSYYRAKIESMRIRFQESKPLTRAMFHFSLGTTCFGMWAVPSIYEQQFFIVSICGLVVLPTIINWWRRLRHSLKLSEENC